MTAYRVWQEALTNALKHGGGRATLTLCFSPDAVLMDIRMPALDGIHATRRLLDGAAPKALPCVLILTTFDLDEYVYEAMKAGASGLLLKDVDPPGLPHAVRVVASGDTLLGPAITRRLIERFVRLPRPGATRPEKLDLRDRVQAVALAYETGLIERGSS